MAKHKVNNRYDVVSKSGIKSIVLEKGCIVEYTELKALFGSTMVDMETVESLINPDEVLLKNKKKIIITIQEVDANTTPFYNPFKAD